MKLSVLIVNYNVKHFLEQCLYSVLLASKNIKTEIFVVDNNSTDGSKEFLAPLFPMVNFIWLTENAGFAKANNIAAGKASGAYLLFLNPDTIVPEDAFENCIRFFEENQQTGAVGVKMIDGTGRFLKESKRAFPSPFTSLFKILGLASLFPKSGIFARYHLGHLSNSENQEVDVLAGAFMMVTRNIIDRVGSFDEQFFMYGEDVDLSYRIQKAGFKNFYLASTTIIHFKGESTKKGSLNYVRLFYKAMNQFVQKHYKGTKARFFILLIQLGIALRAAMAAIGKLLQRIGLPLLDALIIWAGFWVGKYLWNTFITKEITYSPNLLIVAFPLFTLLFLISSFYSGLYDMGYKRMQLIRSTAISSLVLLSGYALLPEDYRFSRGILILGIAFSFIFMHLLRQVFLWFGFLQIDEDKNQQTVIVANDTAYEHIRKLMQHSNEKVLGQISPGNSGAVKTLGNINQLSHLIHKYAISELIFCQNDQSFKDIISTIQQLPPTVKKSFHSFNSKSIIGSNNKNYQGSVLTHNEKYLIGLPSGIRNKRLVDLAFCFVFILSFPVHFFTQKAPFLFYKNLFNVLLSKKTWVGYALVSMHLPKIKPGILSSTSLPAHLNELPSESLHISDEWYATGFSIITDIKKIIRGYKYLSA